MTVPFDIKVPGIHDVRVDADGDIEIEVDGGYHGETQARAFTIDELDTMREWANAQKDAHKAYQDAGYEEEVYFTSINKFKTWKGITA